jgi:hypothetical protein
MNQEQINKQTFERLSKLEAVVFQKKQSNKNVRKSKKNSLPDLILGLKESGFFSQPKTVKEVYEKLLSKYPCDVNRVQVALLRLKGRKLFRITNKIIGGKKVLAYVW